MKSIEGVIPISAYYFEYRLIPDFIRALTEQLPAERVFLHMADREWLIRNVTALGYDPEFEWADFQVDLFRSAIGELIAVYTFPTPTGPPLAQYGAVVANNRGVQYYTLELSDAEAAAEGIGSSWMLGTQSAEGHSTIAEARGCGRPEEFVEVLQENHRVSMAEVEPVNLEHTPAEEVAGWQEPEEGYAPEHEPADVQPEPEEGVAGTVTYDEDEDAEEEDSTGTLVTGLIMFFGSFAVAMVWDKWFWYIMLAGAVLILKAMKNWITGILAFCVLLAGLLYTAAKYL